MFGWAGFGMGSGVCFLAEGEMFMLRSYDGLQRVGGGNISSARSAVVWSLNSMQQSLDVLLLAGTVVYLIKSICGAKRKTEKG